MIIAGEYSFNRGREVVAERYAQLRCEVEQAIASVDAQSCKRKKSREITMPGRVLFSPVRLNKAFTKAFDALGWKTCRVRCEYPTQYYVPGYRPEPLPKGAFREMDFIKGGLGVEVQFGKYAFMVYNVCAKMTIFHRLGHVDAGIEIVPVKQFADEMSTGVSYFEQFVWDLEQRGVSDIDIPVLVLGVDAEGQQAR